MTDFEPGIATALELHTKMPIHNVAQWNHEPRDTCRHCGEELDVTPGARHFEAGNGDILCTTDGPLYHVCEYCYGISDGNVNMWPCSTVTALGGES